MGFVNPLFFIGVLAAAVPILLHLIKRERAQKVEFPTLMFLRRISKKTIRYQKLRHLLLLLLRVLAFVLIVLAFMRPFRKSTQATAAVGRVTSAHVIVLDKSMSMSYEDRWRRARKAAAEIVRSSTPGDKFVVLEFTDRTEARMQLTADPSEALAALENGEDPTDQPTRYAQALRAAEKFALDAGTGRRVIHLISDFQKNGWDAEEQDFRLDAGVELKPVDVGADAFSNLAIRDVHIAEADQSVAAGMTIKASVVDFGTLDRKNVRITLFLDGRAVVDKRIDIGKGSSQGFEFQLPGLISGTHLIVIEVDDPALTRDNRFNMTVEARGKTPVLAAENPDNLRRSSSSFFLANALNIDTLSPYKLTEISAQNATISGGLLIWNNAPGGGAAMQQKLQDFVRRGGGLAIVLADSSMAADFNRSFGSWLPVKAIEGSSAERPAARPGEDYVLMTDVRMDHPIFRPFSKPHSGAFSGARFFKYARLAAGAGAEVAARFDNGDPALISINAGKGRVLIFTSSADDSSNDLPLKTVYLPFWHQMLRYLENFQERRHWLEIGDTISPRKFLAEFALLQSKGRLDTDEAIVVLDPTRQRILMAPGSDDIAVDKAGFYEIRTMNLNAAIAVNTTPRESDLAHGDPEEMAAAWTSSKSAAFSQDEQPAPEEQDRRQRFWGILLAAALLLMASELFLSNQKRVTNYE